MSSSVNFVGHPMDILQFLLGRGVQARRTAAIVSEPEEVEGTLMTIIPANVDGTLWSGF